jgi:alcohol dehydrogenase class IV
VINRFTFGQIPSIIFGPGQIAVLPSLIAPLAVRTLIVTGKHSLRSTPHWQTIEKGLNDASIAYDMLLVSGEPTVEDIDVVVDQFKAKNIGAVAAIGGGSVIDTGKAIAAMLKAEGSVRDYLEGVGTKKPTGAKVPFVAVPTTSGTGSEATRNAVISQVGENGFKKSLRHEKFMPDYAIIDPELTLTCPPEVSAACGLDAFTQLLEAYVSMNSNPMADALALSGLEFTKHNLVAVCGAGAHDLDARSAMAYAALMSGLVLNFAGLGVVHGFASSIGGFFNIPHGVICGILLGPATQVTIEQLQKNKDAQAQIALGKYARIGHLLSGRKGDDVTEGCDRLVATLMDWKKVLNIPSLKHFGVGESHFDRIVKNTENKNNPARLTPDEMMRILTL